MSEYSTISLYTGAGGLDFGLERAGFDVSAAVEMDKWCCTTIRHNRRWPLFEGLIENTPTDAMLAPASLSKGDVDILVGGPPCQPFSKSSYWVNGDSYRLKDPRAKTLNEYMRVLDEALPRAYILENVFGLAYKNKDEGLKFLEKAIEQINKRNGTNYSFQWNVLNAADYGVPQIRERIFIVGSRDGRKFDFPSRRHYPGEKLKGSLLQYAAETYRTAWDAIGDLTDDAETYLPSRVGGKWGDLLPSIPPGENYLWHTDRKGGKQLFRWRSRYWSFLLKLHPRKPSWTIQAQPGTAIGPFHWKNRRLTRHEMARLQTFPDDVEVQGGISQVQSQIGNAVPSAIGELLGKEIRKQFFDNSIESDLTLVPEKRNATPEIYHTKQVPQKYLK